MCNDLGIKVEVLNDGIGIKVNIYRPSYKPTEEPTIKQIKSEDLTEQEQKIYWSQRTQKRILENIIRKVMKG